MPKKPTRQRVPRTRAGGTFTEAQFWSFIRSGLRSKSQRWPPRYQVLNGNRKRVQGKRHRYEHQCAICEGWFKQSDVEVDHIEPCGSLKSYDDLPGFVEKLFCEPEGLRILCKTCHKKITKGERDAKDITS